MAAVKIDLKDNNLMNDKLDAAQREVERKAAEEAKRQAKAEAMREIKQAKAKATTTSRELVVSIVENPSIIKGCTLVCALALIVISILSLFSIVPLSFLPMVYVMVFFNIIAGMAIVLVEGPSQWEWYGIRPFVFMRFGFLAHPVGRAMFYLYVGSETFSLGWGQGDKWFYCVVGACLFACAVLQFLGMCSVPKKKDAEESKKQAMSPDAQV